MSRSRFLYRAVTGAVAAAMLLTACGSDGDDEAPDTETHPDTETDPDAEVTISVMMLPPEDQPVIREAFLARVELLEQENPNITVEPTEIRFEPETFQAMLAAGTLPTVIHVPFTEPQGLIARGQVSDITEEIDEIENFQELNPDLLDLARDADGRVYGIPVESYDQGLAYNRELFEQAGLDPDDPPTTWDEVRGAAQAITAATGQAGFAQMTTDNTGGWKYTTLTYSFGGSVQEQQDDGTYRASFNSPEGRQALEYLQTLRWEDDVMGENFLLNQAQIREEFAAGRIGMYIEGAAGFTKMVQLYDLDPAGFGFGPLPQQGGVHGALTGGAMAMIAPGASPEERLAGLKWIELNYLRGFFDEELARTQAEARVADGEAVGVPVLTPVSDEQYATYQGFIEDLINIPLENFDPYFEARDAIPLFPEPPVMAQQTYSILDSMIQGVLTREDVDIGALLSEAESNVNNILSAS